MRGPIPLTRLIRLESIARPRLLCPRARGRQLSVPPCAAVDQPFGAAYTMVEQTAARLPGGGNNQRTPRHARVTTFVRPAYVSRFRCPVNGCGNAVTTRVKAPIDGSNDFHLDPGPLRVPATHDAATLAPCNARTGGRKARAIRRSRCKKHTAGIICLAPPSLGTFLAYTGFTASRLQSPNVRRLPPSLS